MSYCGRCSRMTKQKSRLRCDCCRHFWNEMLNKCQSATRENSEICRSRSVLDRRYIHTMLANVPYLFNLVYLYCDYSIVNMANIHNFHIVLYMSLSLQFGSCPISLFNRFINRWLPLVAYLTCRITIFRKKKKSQIIIIMIDNRYARCQDGMWPKPLLLQNAKTNIITEFELISVWNKWNSDRNTQIWHFSFVCNWDSSRFDCIFFFFLSLF